MFDIHKSWQRFKLGLVLFVAGVCLLLTISALHIFLYYVALIILLLGFVIAMTGYAGIFMQRFSFIKNKKTPPDFNDQ